MKKIFLTLACALSIGAMAQTEENVAYLFTYFTGNAPEQEQIHYAISYNGFDYTPLNGGEPIIGSDSIAIKKGVRDPHILRGEDGYFYMVVTDMRCKEGWSSNRGMVLLRSKDMVKWSHHTVHFPEKYKNTMFEHVTRVWAPQTIYDKEAGKYMVYFSILTDDGSCPYDKVYWAYANKDFSDLEGEPQVLFDVKEPAIDTDIILDEDGFYHVFFKMEGDGKKGIAQFIAQDLHKPQDWFLRPGTCQDTQRQGEAVEGAGVFKRLDGRGYILMYDCYGSGYYQFCKSDDLLQFKSVKNTKTQGKFTPRHGTVMPITQNELNRLLKAFPIEK